MPIRHELFQREILLRGELASAAVHQATVLGHPVEPHYQRLGAVELGEIWNGLQENLLHGVLGIFALAAYSHAEGENGILKQN